MELKSKNKIDKNGKIFSDELITEKQGYDAMIYMLEYYYNATNSNDLTDILCAGYSWEDGIPLDSAYWEYWLIAVDAIKNKKKSPK
ncbi:conserved hypothetical protein [Tenacibaculum litopenaei]|uniref:hypothetical protein n=1 Tax=Tenacibaculum litopenaei TaxID=396016 RepID=UPI0038959E63